MNFTQTQYDNMIIREAALVRSYAQNFSLSLGQATYDYCKKSYQFWITNVDAAKQTLVFCSAAAADYAWNCSKELDSAHFPFTPLAQKAIQFDIEKELKE